MFINRINDKFSKYFFSLAVDLVSLWRRIHKSLLVRKLFGEIRIDLLS